jgi:hypothetical protein
MSCEQRIVPLLKNQLNFEFPYFLFDEANCQGNSFPDIDSFPVWDIKMDIEELDLKNIDSLYIPGHCTMELFSHQGNNVKLRGPALIKKFSAYLLFWRSPFEQTNVLSEETLEYKNQLTNEKILFKDIEYILFKRTKTWDSYIEELAIHDYPIQIGKEEIKIDVEQFLTQKCRNGRTTINCHCINVFNDLKRLYPDFYKEMYINNIDNSCDPNKHYVPKDAKVGTHQEEECTSMFLNMIKKNLKNIDQVQCSGKYFKVEKEKNSENNSENEDEENSFPYMLILYVILGTIAFFMIVYVLYYYYYAKNEKKLSKRINNVY